MTAMMPASDGIYETWEGCEDRESAAAWEQASLESDGTPALAERFRISDPQQWLDLCA